MTTWLRSCRRPDRGDTDELCFCPKDKSDVRQVLAQPFINGWVQERWMQKAKLLANDPQATQEQAEALLAQIEESANDCYGMWRHTL